MHVSVKPNKFVNYVYQYFTFNKISGNCGFESRTKSYSKHSKLHSSGVRYACFIVITLALLDLT